MPCLPLRSLLSVSVLSLAACSITPSVPTDFRVYEQERFGAEAPHAKSFAVPAPAACQAARRTLLGQGYFLYVEEPARLHGRKFFRPAAGTSVELAINVTCLPQPESEEQALVYAVAWQDAFVTKRNPVAASVGAPILGSVSMPVATTDDALVKVGVETVQEPTYYERFFAQLASLLPRR